MKHLKLVIIGLAVLINVGCGGGGGGGSSASAPINYLQSAPGNQAISNYYLTSHNNTLSAKDSSGNAYTLQTSYQYGGSNATVMTTTGSETTNIGTQTITLSKNGNVASTEIDTVYFLTSPFQIIQNTTSGGSSTNGYGQTYGQFPTTLTVGTSGPVGTYALYSGSFQVGTETDTYSVSTFSATAIQVCINAQIVNGTTQTGSQCYSVDSSGNANLISVTASANGASITFK